MKTRIIRPLVIEIPPSTVVVDMSEKQAAILDFLAARDLVIPKALRQAGFDGGFYPTYAEVETFQHELLASLRTAGTKTFDELNKLSVSR